MVAAALAAASLACTPQPGAGVVAYTSAGALKVLALGSCETRTLAERGAGRPVRFSHDGRWIGFGRGKVVSAEGGRVLSPLGPVQSWSWSPTRDVLAGITVRGAVVENRPGGRPVLRKPPGWGATTLVWAPDGRSYAVGRRGEVVWFSPGERPLAVYRDRRLRSSPPLLVGFGGGFGHLFFQPDFANSASIAMDGLPLVPLEAARGTAIAPVVRAMLPVPGFFADCGKHVVVTAGGNRDTTTNKRLVVATFRPGWDRFAVRDLSRDRALAWVSPACSPDGRSVAAAAGPDSGNASLVRPRRAIWLLSLDGRTGRRLTRPPAGWSDDGPVWTANGKGVLFVRQRRDRGLLYLARLDGTLDGPLARVNGALVGIGLGAWPFARTPAERLAAVGCTPQPGLGVVTYTRGGKRHRFDLATCSDGVTGPARAARPPGPLVSPGGRFAATVRTTGARRTLRDTIWITDRRSGRAHAAYSAGVWGSTGNLASPGPIMLRSWSGDDRFVFFAIDPGSSVSLADDGLILRVVPAAGGPAHRLPVTLVWRNYLAWCGGRLVFTAGGDRVATQHKQLDVAGPPDWRARPLVRAPGRAWGAIACAPDGRSVVVQSQPASDVASFFATRWQLWRVGLDGTRTQLTSPPAQHADESPRLSRDGRTILFVRSRRGNGELYALRGGRVAGPLLSLGHEDGWYGHQDWWRDRAMTWSR